MVYPQQVAFLAKAGKLIPSGRNSWEDKLRYASLVGVGEYLKYPQEAIPTMLGDLLALDRDFSNNGYSVRLLCNPVSRRAALRCLSISIGLAREDADVVAIYIGGHGTHIGDSDDAILLSEYDGSVDSFAHHAIFREDVNCFTAGASCANLYASFYDACRHSCNIKLYPFLTSSRNWRPIEISVLACRPEQRLALGNADGTYFRQGLSYVVDPGHPASTIHQTLRHANDKVSLLSKGTQAIHVCASEFPISEFAHPWSVHFVTSPDRPLPKSVPQKSILKATFPFIDIEDRTTNEIIGRLCIDVDLVGRKWLPTIIDNIRSVMLGQTPRHFVKPGRQLRRRHVLDLDFSELAALEKTVQEGKLETLPLNWIAFWSRLVDEPLASCSAPDTQTRSRTICGSRLYEVGMDDVIAKNGCKFYSNRRGTAGWLLHRIRTSLFPAILSDLKKLSTHKLYTGPKAEVRQCLGNLEDHAKLENTACGGYLPAFVAFCKMLAVFFGTIKNWVEIDPATSDPSLEWNKILLARRRLGDEWRKRASVVFTSATWEWTQEIVEELRKIEATGRFPQLERAIRKIDRRIERSSQVVYK